MTITEAIKILNRNNLLCEFLYTSLSKEQLCKRLKELNPKFNKDYIQRNNSDRESLLTIKVSFLRPTGLGPKDFNEFLHKYGWNLIGYTNKSLVMAPLTAMKYIDDSRKSKIVNRIISASRGWYIRFSSIPPSFVKKYGFRTTKDRNISSNDIERSGDRWFNEDRVYLYSLENCFYDKLSEDEISVSDIKDSIRMLLLSGNVYGDYCYMMKLSPNIKVYNDPEYDGDMSPGYILQNVPSSSIKKCINMKGDVISEILDTVGLSEFDAKDSESLENFSFDFDDESKSKFDKSRDLVADEPAKNKYSRKLREILNDYDMNKIAVKIKGVDDIFSLIYINDYHADDMEMYFAGKDNADEKIRLNFYLSNDGTVGVRPTLSNLLRNKLYKDLFTAKDIIKSSELNKFLSDPRTVKVISELDNKVYNKAEKTFDPRNHKHKLSKNWGKW